MSVSEAKLALAQDLNKILQILYKGVSQDGFNLDVDLSSIPSYHLQGFFTYVSGYLCLRNTEEITELLVPEDIENMLNGHFIIRLISREEVDRLIKQAGAKNDTNQAFSSRTKLYSIQDGTYYVEKNVSKRSISSKFINFVSLETDPIEIYSDYNLTAEAPVEIFRFIRNIFAHGAPYINGRQMTFVRGKDSVVVSKMWLRGFAEMFSRRSSPISAEQIEKKLTDELTKNSIYLESPSDVDKAMSFIKDFFDDETRKEYYRLNNFVKSRILLYNDFYSMKVEDKIKILSGIVASNPNYIFGTKGKVNSSVIYNIEQIIANELEKRGEHSELSKEDLAADKLLEYLNELRAIEKEMEGLAKLPRGLRQRKIDSLSKRHNDVTHKFESYKRDIERKKKLETSNMDMCQVEALAHLPVEVAVNLVCLLGFNNIVISDFYEEVVKNCMYGELTKQQNQILDKLSLEKLTRHLLGKTYKGNNTNDQKVSMLHTIRHAICHGRVSHQIPTSKKDSNFSYKDVVLIFDSPKQQTQVSGRLEDFYELFSSPVFLQNRSSKKIDDKKPKDTQPGDDE